MTARGRREKDEAISLCSSSGDKPSITAAEGKQMLCYSKGDYS